MKRLLPFILLFVVVTCNIIPQNLTDPENPSYVKPYLIFDSTNVHTGDTIAVNEIFLDLKGNIPDKNQFRYRMDSLAWSAWQPTQSTNAIRITLAEADTGKHTLIIETCYNPSGDITDTSILFVKVNTPRITATSDTAVNAASDQLLRIWVKVIGTEPIVRQWYFNAAKKSGAAKDTLPFDSVKLTDQGSYFMVAANRWGADTSATIRLTVSKTNYAPKWKADTLRFGVSEGQILTQNLADSCVDNNGEPLIFRMLVSPFGGDSLSPEGIFTFAAGPHDSGTYRATALVSDGGLADTVILITTVRHVNHAPVFIDSLPKSSYQIKEGDQLPIRFKAIDVDGDRLSYFVKQTNLPRKTEAVLAESTLTWQSTVNDGGAYTMKLAAFDGKDTGFVDIDIAVGNVNLPPRITIVGKTNGQTITVKEQDTLRFTVLVSDPNSGDTPVLRSVKNAPYTNVANGTGSYDTASGKFVYVPSFAVSTQRQQTSFANVLFTARDNTGSLDSFRITISVADSNRPPTVTLLEPADNAMAISKNTLFKWRVYDPDGDSVISTVRLGIISTQLNAVQQSIDSTGRFPSVLLAGQQYFWQASVSDGAAQIVSATRRFTVNNPPQLTLKQPADGATGIGLPVSITWEGVDIDSGDQSKLVYDVYFANRDSSLVRVSRDTAATSKTMSALRYNTTYQWKIVAKDGKDTTASAVYALSTFVPTSKLTSLQLINVTLAPAFQPYVTAYAASLSYEVDSVKILPIAADSLAVIKVGSTTVKSGSSTTVKGLPVGLDTIPIRVTARDGIAVDTYTVIVSRTKPNTFQRYFGQTENDAGYAAVQLPDSSYLIGGCIGSTSQTGFTRLVKITSTGELSWAKQYGKTSNVNSAYAMVQAANGHLVVLSQDIDTVLNRPHIWLFECDTSGIIIWQKSFSCSGYQFSCSGYQYEYGRTLAKTADNGYLIAARALSDARTDAKIWLIKTTAAGVRLWDSTYGGPSYDDVGGIYPLSDGSALVGGSLREAGNGNDSAWIFKIDVNGKRIWSVTYPEFYKGGIQGITSTTDGSIFICGSMMGQNYITNSFLAKISSNGNMLKTTKLEGTLDYGLTAIKPTMDGNLILSGVTGLNSNQDGWLLKASTGCDTLWSRKFGSPGYDYFKNVTLTNDGGFILTGYLYNSGMWLVKTDRDGLIW